MIYTGSALKLVRDKSYSLIAASAVFIGSLSFAVPTAGAEECHGNNSYDEHVYMGGAPGANVSVYMAKGEMDSCKVKDFYESLDNRETADNYIAGFTGLAGYYGKAVALVTLIDSVNTHFDSKRKVRECSAEFTKPIRFEIKGPELHSCTPQ